MFVLWVQHLSKPFLTVITLLSTFYDILCDAQIPSIYLKYQIEINVLTAKISKNKSHEECGSERRHLNDHIPTEE